MSALTITWPIVDLDVPLSVLLHQATGDTAAHLAGRKPTGPPVWTITAAKPRGLALTVAVPLEDHPRLVVSPPRPEAPHGTHAAFNRHKGRGEVPCAECVVGERDYQRDRARKRRARARGAAT